jgi:hypothetical protein
LVYRSWTGVQAIVDGFQARCTRSADALGVFGSVLRGPSIGRFDLTIVPFHGSGRYRSDTTHNEVGGSISVTGSVQAYLGPPQESAAEVAADGALGEVRFATTNIDGRPLIGSLRWECSEVQA